MQLNKDSNIQPYFFIEFDTASNLCISRGWIYFTFGLTKN